MYVSKSFCNIAAFLSNAPGSNSPIGELTTYGETFAREVGVYQDSAQPGFTLYNFKSVNDGANGSTIGPAIVPSLLVSQFIGLISFLTTKIQAAVGNQLYTDQLLADLTAYSAAHQLNSISIGDIVQHDQLWAPNWIRFQSELVTTGTPATSVPNENTIWISIASFVTEYDEYEIVVVPLIDNLDLFFGTGTSVVNFVNAMTSPQIIDKMQAAQNGVPPTIQRSDLYTYINPLNSGQTIAVNWPVLIYGPAGNDVDAIKDALINYILANSSHNRAQWTLIFPDIFKRTEFIVAPHWNLYAIANRTQAAGVYSPIINYNAGKAYMKLVVPLYDPTFVDTHANALSHPYRSLLLSIVGGSDNRSNLFEISQVFPDYIDVASTSLDFNRMSPDTQGWALMIANMLLIAETMNEHTTLPQGLTKVTRANILYLVQTYKNIQYLVASKRAVYQLLNLTYA